MTPKDALYEIYDMVGSKTAVSRHCNVALPALTYWEEKRIPAERAVQLEELGGGKITRHDLRPDLFGPKPRRVAPKHRVRKAS